MRKRTALVLASLVLAAPAVAQATQPAPTWQQARHAIQRAANGATVGQCRRARGVLVCPVALSLVVSVNGGAAQAEPPLRWMIKATWRGGRLRVWEDFSQSYTATIRTSSR